LYVVYMCQKSLNFTYAFKCYQQNVSGFTLAGPPCIVTIALSRVVSEIFDVEKYRDLDIRVRGYSRSLIVVPFERMGMVSY